MLDRFLIVLLSFLGFSAASVQAGPDPVLPQVRYQSFADTDYYGSDLQALFDTDLNACQRACSAQQACAGFSYNNKANACFPKSEMKEATPYTGAISALKRPISAAQQAAASQRAGRLDRLRPADLQAALRQAREIGLRYPSRGETLEDMIRAGRGQARSGGVQSALGWLSAAVAVNDDPALWTEVSALWLRIADQSKQNKNAKRQQALAAALNGYLRAEAAPLQAEALVTAGRALESLGRGRDMISVLRLAQDLAPRADTAALLDEAIGKYGFRVTDSTVESDSAAPRICVEFSEDLARSGVDYGDYVKGAGAELAAEASGRQLCLDGAEHGERYRIALRRGLPAASGEVLSKEVELTHYVRDRTPSVRFPGRAYVLAKSDQVALPVETVNLREVALQLRQVSDRNLLRTLQEGYFGRPLSHWQDEYFASDIGQEVWTGTASVQDALNQDMTTRIPLVDVLADRPVGIYALTARVPGADPYEDPGATQWFVLTDLGLSTMSGADGLHVQVQGLTDAKPRADVEVTLISNANAVLAKARTDATGYVRFDPGLSRGRGAAAPAMVMAQQGEEDFSFLSLKDAAFDLSDRGVEGRPAPGPVDVFLATDRGAYRAGEVIHVTALTRDSGARAITDLPVTAILHRPDGVEYSRQVSDGGQAGGHVFNLPIGQSAPRGTWRLDLKTDPKAPALATRQLLVEDFLPERIDFTQTVANAAALVPGEAAQLDISARYLFGAPGSGLTIDGDLRLSASDTVAAWPGYRFGRYDAPGSPQRAYFGGDKTDTAGQASVVVSLPAAATMGKPMQATIVTRVMDGAARPVERELTLPVRPATPVIGIRPLFDDVVGEGSEAGFEVIALSPDLSPLPMQVKWTLNRVETRYQWYQLYGNWNWEPTTRRTRIATGETTLGQEPVNLSEQVEWGRYELVIERLDGTPVTAALDFYAGWYAPADSAATPDRLELSLNAESYQPGDTARLRIVPRAGGTALISVVSNHLIDRMAVEVPAGESTIPLTVTEAWGSGAYVTATVLQPVTGKASRTPARALGLAHVSVSQPGQELSVAINVPEVARPRGTEMARVRVDGAAAGEEVWLTVAAVDLGILNLTGFKSPDPSAHYHGQRRLGMELRDLYGRLIDPGNGAMGQVRSGGDADNGMRMQSPPPTQDLVAVFSGPLQLDANGEALFPVDLPAFNGTVRLMAVAWSKRAVGQAEADMLVRDPVVVTATVPRFLAPGDSSRARIEIVHADGPAGEMALSARAIGTGLELGPLPGAVTLAEQGKAVLELPLTAQAVGDPEIELTLTTPAGLPLVQRLRMPVRANDPVVAQTRRFRLSGGDSFQFSADVFAGLRPGSARAVLSAGPLAKFDVPGLLAQLDRYPYGCTEQVTSTAMPLLYLSSVAEAAGLGNGPAVKARIDAAIRKVLTRQASNGAFGLWRAESGDFWLDAYASDFLSRARAQGYAVPDQAFAQAMDNLRNRINYAPDFDNGGEDIAYALMVLAREGAAAMGDLRYYADVKAGDFATPLAAAQLGAALAAYGDQPRADRMFGRAAQMLGRSGAETPVWRVDYGTHRRDAAAVLALASEAGSAAVSQEYLMARVTEDGSRMSTQEAAWTLLAAQALVSSPEDSGLLVNGQSVAGPFVEVLDGSAAATGKSISAASGRSTEITLTTLGVPVVAPEAGGYGYTLNRSYYTLEGEPIAELSFETGARFVTVLSVVPHEGTGARLMVDDPLPAGFEIDNPNLLRSGDLRDLDWLKLDQATHAEFRSDRFLAAVDIGGTETVTLAYVTRAVTPGSFHHPAASVEDMYRPAYRARTAAGRVQIR
ncbi:MG2 domain-containing protein [Pseudophaeobacter sp. C1-32P7]|uniref:alpha-2-macroglobulin family protein n=1 Tax=Pseudophaeobacter sp. C1-32P7 TaxID=3098142 RepID=UPI0034D4A75B